MNHAELVAAIAQNTARSLSKADVADALNSLALVAQAALSQGGEVTLKGLGKLATKTRAARTGRNPQTGDAVQIAAKTVPTFSAAKALKEAINA